MYLILTLFFLITLLFENMFLPDAWKVIVLTVKEKNKSESIFWILIVKSEQTEWSCNTRKDLNRHEIYNVINFIINYIEFETHFFFSFIQYGNISWCVFVRSWLWQRKTWIGMEERRLKTALFGTRNNMAWFNRLWFDAFKTIISLAHWSIVSCFQDQLHAC